MKRIVKLGICILALGLLGTLSIEAQPQRGMGDPGRMMGMMGGAQVEQVLAFLAFDDEVGVTDEQLLKLRKDLKEVYVKQQETMQEMRDGGGDFRKLGEKMTALREEMNEKISAVLDAEQVKLFEAYMKTLESRRGGFQGRRSPGGGRGSQF